MALVDQSKPLNVRTAPAGVKEVRLLGIPVSNLNLAREEQGSRAGPLDVGF